jgi:hypothetical protein
MEVDIDLLDLPQLFWIQNFNRNVIHVILNKGNVANREIGAQELVIPAVSCDSTSIEGLLI